MDSGDDPSPDSADRERANETLKRMFKDILTFAIRKARPGIDPEDLAQEASLRYLEAMAARQTIFHEKTWCLQVLLNYQSDERRQGRRLTDVDLNGLSAPEDISAFVACAYATMDEFRDTLPPGQLKILDRLLRGDNSSEIARALEVSEQYVAKTLSRLRKKFGLFLNQRLGNGVYISGDGTSRHPPGQED